MLVLPIHISPPPITRIPSLPTLPISRFCREFQGGLGVNGVRPVSAIDIPERNFHTRGVGPRDRCACDVGSERQCRLFLPAEASWHSSGGDGAIVSIFGLQYQYCLEVSEMFPSSSRAVVC